MRTRCLATLLLVLVAACGEESTTPPAGVQTPDLPADQVLFDLSHVMTKDGVRVAVLDADTAYLFEEGRRFDLVGVRLRFFAEDGSEAGVLTSRTGEYDLEEEQFIARGDAVLVTQGAEGERRLETEELYYHVPGDRLWSETPFVMTEGTRVTRGASFHTDGRFGTWEVVGAETEGGLPSDTEIVF